MPLCGFGGMAGMRMKRYDKMRYLWRASEEYEPKDNYLLT